MSDTQELRTNIVWDTTDVDRGLKRVESACDRLGKAEYDAALRAGKIRATEAQQRARDLRLSEIAERSSNDRRYQDAKSLNERLLRLHNEHHRTVSRDARSRSGAGGAGVRMAGDAINAATGSSGNVMRLNMLSHMGPLAGGAAVIAGMVAKSIEARNLMLDASQDSKAARGESAPSLLSQKLGPLINLLPKQFQPDPLLARRDPLGYEGLSHQSESIQESTKKLQGSRGFFASLYSTFAEPFSRASLGDSFSDEEKNQDKLNSIDARKAGIVSERSAASRIGLTEGDHAGALAKAMLDLREALAKNSDDQRDGKIRLQEKHAADQAARAAAEDAAARIDQSRAAFDNANREIGSNTYIRGRGEDVELRSAQNRLLSARSAVDNALNPEQKAAADAAYGSAHQDVIDAERNTRARKATLAVDQEIADFRGGAEARTLHSAEANLRKEQALLSIAKERGVDAEREAKIRVSSATLALDLVKQEEASRRQNNASALSRGVLQQRSAIFALGQNAGSIDENIRFSAGQAVARNQAAVAVAEAKETLDNATKQVAIEKQSEASIQAQRLAQQALNQAKIAQLQTEKQLAQESLDRKRSIADTALAARNQTAGMRLGNAGRSDLANLANSRASTQAKVLAFERAGRHDLAAEAMAQQAEHETELHNAKFLTPDGHRRRAGLIHRDERNARNTQRRLERANARLAKNEGLINVQRDTHGHLISGIDPITRQKVTADQLYARKHSAENQAKAEKAEEAKVMADIKSILEKRLPAAAQ